MNMAWIKYLMMSIALGVTLSHDVYASVVLNSSRVIYESSKNEVSVSVRNNDQKRAFLIQSWVDNELEANKQKTPFIITPPLFKLEPDQEGLLRIVLTDAALPSDRESIFWLNVKSIPSIEKSDKNRLFLSINNRVKLFYRPDSLPGNAADAYKQLTIVRQGDTLRLRNPTPYYVSLRDLRVGEKNVESPIMVPPKGELTHTLKPGMSGKISWSAINDFGGTTSAISQ